MHWLCVCYQGFRDLSARRSNWQQTQVWYQRSLEPLERRKQVVASSIYDRRRCDHAAHMVARAAKKILRELILRLAVSRRVYERLK